MPFIKKTPYLREFFKINLIFLSYTYKQIRGFTL